jgi:hypothetical protein
VFSMMNDPAITAGTCHVLELSNGAVIGIERRLGDSVRAICLVNLTEADAEIAFSTDAWSLVDDYRQMRIVSTELHRSPQFDLWPGGMTVRLRGHEGLLLTPPR